MPLKNLLDSFNEKFNCEGIFGRESRAEQALKDFITLAYETGKEDALKNQNKLVSVFTKQNKVDAIKEFVEGLTEIKVTEIPDDQKRELSRVGREQIFIAGQLNMLLKVQERINNKLKLWTSL